MTRPRQVVAAPFCRDPAGDVDATFFSWEAHDGPRGSCGVTRESARATARLIDALSVFSPGAAGSIRLARLDRQARRPSYDNGRIVAMARRDEGTGLVVFEPAGE